MNLLQIARAVVSNPAFETKDITGDGVKETFCNWGLRLIAEAAFDYHGFRNLSANQIHRLVSTNPQWRKIDGATAAELSKRKLVISAQASASGSGHVAIVVPEKMLQSGKWAKAVPQVANVGKNNGIIGANFAYATEPEYFVLEV